MKYLITKMVSTVIIYHVHGCEKEVNAHDGGMLNLPSSATHHNRLLHFICDKCRYYMSNCYGDLQDGSKKRHIIAILLCS